MHNKLTFALRNTLCTVSLLCRILIGPHSQSRCGCHKGGHQYSYKLTWVFQSISHHSAELKILYDYSVCRYHKF